MDCHDQHGSTDYSLNVDLHFRASRVILNEAPRLQKHENESHNWVLALWVHVGPGSPCKEYCNPDVLYVQNYTQTKRK